MTEKKHAAAQAVTKTTKTPGPPKPLVRRLLLPLAGMLLLLLTGGAVLLWQQHQADLEQRLAMVQATVKNEFQRDLKNQAATLEATLQAIAADPRTQWALATGDVGTLMKDWRPLYDTLHTGMGLTHFYFFDTGRTCILRVHRPEKHGDHIDRFTARETERTGAMAWGLEIGPLGLLTLRVVRPVLLDGERVGYAELGKEIEDMLQTRHAHAGSHLAVIIHKEFLDRENWSESMRRLGREPEWERLSHCVVAFSTMGRLPDAFLGMADRPLASDVPARHMSADVSAEGKRWRVSPLPLMDASGQEVGHLLVITDITQEQGAFRRFLFLVVASGVVLMAALLGFVFVLLRRADAGIAAQQAELRGSEEKYRVLFDTLPLGITIVDQGGAIVETNAAAQAILGVSKEEHESRSLYGKQWHVIRADGSPMPPEEYAGVRALRENRLIESVEMGVERPDGDVTWLAVTAAPFHLDTFNVVIAYNDITERKLAEHRMQESHQRLLTVMDAMDALIYIADMETHELLFLNAYGRKAFGEVIGRKCWEALQTWQTGPCAFCTNPMLLSADGEATGVHHWEFLNTADGRWYDCRDQAIPWAGGRLVRMEVATDITDRKRTEEELRAMGRMQALLTELATGFINLPLDVVDAAIDSALARLGAFVGADRVHVFAYDQQRLLATNTHEWCAQGIVPQIMNLRNEPMDSMDEWVQRHQRGETIHIPDVSALPQDSPERRALEPQGIKSLLVVPMLHEGECQGFCGFDSVRQHHVYTDEERQLLQVFAQMLLNARLRKQTAQRLQKSEANLRESQVIARMGRWELDLRDNRLSWSDEMFDLFELTPQDFAASYEAFLAFVHPEDRSLIDRIYQESLEKKTPYEVEHRLLLRDGRIKWVNEIGRNEYDDTGKPLRSVGITQDITARKKAEELIREANIQLEEALGQVTTIMSAVPVGILVFDQNARVIDDNPAARQMFNSRDFALGSVRCGDYIACCHRHGHTDGCGSTPHCPDCEINAAIRQVLQGGGAVGEQEKEIEQSTGDSFWIRFSVIPVVLREENCALLVARDISARKRAEAELVRARQAAETASQAKSEFLANMSHEIRTPMNGVIGMTGLLLDTRLDQEQRRYAETVQRSGEALLGLINDILDFSKIEAGKLDLEILDFDLVTLLDDVAAFMALRAQEKNLELICHAEPDVPAMLRGDPTRLRQILNNLVGNALKFTGSGEIVILARLEEQDDAGVLLRFTVRDTGIGIPEDKLDLLFDKFSQVDASVTRRFGGTGLGLAISRQLAGLMGGSVGVTSTPGQGSEFWFTARFARTAAQRPAPALPRDLQGLRVLVVDDNPTNLEILGRQLQAWGARPEPCPSGETAMQSMQAAWEQGAPFGLAILDMQMPEMDGEELGKRIKADARFRDTPLVMLTSLGRPGDARRFGELGFAAYLNKPVRQSELFDTLALVLVDNGERSPTRPIITRHLAREAQQRQAPLPRLSGRVLVAEDNHVNQQVALGMLGKLGLNANVAANGQEALEALRTIPYDLVLMDVHMPEMDGLSATREIRRLEREPGRLKTTRPGRPRIPVVAMTAGVMQQDRQKCLEAGMDDFVPKPVNSANLATVLERWLPREEPDTAPESGDLATSDHVGDVAPLGVASAPVFGEQKYPALDESDMQARFMGDMELAKEILGMILEAVPAKIAALHGSVAARDLHEVVMQAHALKGMALNASCVALGKAAEAMEQAGKSGDAEVLLRLLPSLEEQYRRLGAVLRDFL